MAGQRFQLGALVTGANRGIGLEVVSQFARRGMQVILGARDSHKGQQAARPLIEAGLAGLPRQRDVTDQSRINRLASEVANEFGCLDILINNAAILYDTWQRAATADLNLVHEAPETNIFGVWRCARRFSHFCAEARPVASSIFPAKRDRSRIWERARPPIASLKPHSMS